MQQHYNMPGMQYPPAVQNGGWDALTVKFFALVPIRNRYNDVVQRTIAIDGNHQTLGKLEEIFRQSGVKQNAKLMDTTIATSIPEVAFLNPAPLGFASIANGWSTQRLAYILAVESQDVNGISLISYMQGYSDYHDPTYTGRVDDSMPIHINSIITVQRFKDPAGNLVLRPYSSFNVITDASGRGTYQSMPGEMSDSEIARPKDLLSSMNLMAMHSGDATAIYNTSSMIRPNSVFTSSRVNNDPLRHFTKTVNSFIDAKNLTQGTYSGDSDVLLQATSLAGETAITSIPFIAALSKLTGEFSPTSFTLNTLNAICPGVTQYARVAENFDDLVPDKPYALNDTADVASTFQPTQEALKATEITQAVNSVMTENFLTDLTVNITNDSGVPVVSVLHVATVVDGVNPMYFANKAVSRLEQLLIPKLTNNNMSAVNATVASSLLLDTFITISLDFNPFINYRFPTFADSLYVPVITTSSFKDQMIHDTQNILDATYSNDLMTTLNR